ncbi:MAG: LysR family transcriptional regulator, partial [Burkholderiales bacterium]|nr:LysR family transcriptional regulator [Burkholderiales bacterium]
PFDAAIHAGVSAWPGTESLFLMDESLVAVCSPQRAAGRHVFNRHDWQAQTLQQQGTQPHA